mmetsp:Transcript_8601/g.15431  ORF Transcript_8601/g.15431 Transcript_8601/m.15431 type:complete len:237 (+) Transcript_8601:426-1136(+)
MLAVDDDAACTGEAPRLTAPRFDAERPASGLLRPVPTDSSCRPLRALPGVIDAAVPPMLPFMLLRTDGFALLLRRPREPCRSCCLGSKAEVVAPSRRSLACFSRLSSSTSRAASALATSASILSFPSLSFALASSFVSCEIFSVCSVIILWSSSSSEKSAATANPGDKLVGTDAAPHMAGPPSIIPALIELVATIADSTACDCNVPPVDLQLSNRTTCVGPLHDSLPVEYAAGPAV